VQRAVDRRFNRVRYDADQTVAAFAARLQEGADLDAVRSDLLTVVNTAVEPAHISVWTASGPRLPQRAGSPVTDEIARHVNRNRYRQDVDDAVLVRGAANALRCQRR